MTMTRGWRRFAAAVLVSAAFAGPVNSAENLPLPRLTVPRVRQPPVIDGVMATGEWDRAAAATGFLTAFQNELSKVQTVVWVAYDETYLYVCLKNERGEQYTSLKMTGRKPDDGSIVFDHANEIWITPPSSPQETYQTLFNAYPGFFDVKMIPSVGSQSSAWSADWTVASSQTPDHWIVEGRARLDKYSALPVTNGTLWRALFTTDVIGGAGFTAWAPGGAFSDLPRHGVLEFREEAPAVQCLDVTSLRTGKVRIPFAVTGPGEVTATCSLPGVERSRTVRLEAGRREVFTLDAELAVTGGVCRITATDAGGRLLFNQSIPFTVDGHVRRPPARIVTNPYAPEPFGLTAQYAPLSRRLLCRIDRLYMPQRERVAGGVARVVDPATRRVLAEQAIPPFRYDYAEFDLDLSDLEVPVETDEEWRRNEPVLAANRNLPEDRREPLPFPGRVCEVEVELTAAEGGSLARRREPVTLKGFDAEWLNNTLGVSDKVIPPWTPITGGRGGRFHLWNKEYTLDALGLAQRLVNGGAPQLGGPMRLVAVVDGQERVLKPGAPVFRRKPKRDSGVVELEGRTREGDLQFDVRTRLEFDGFVLNDMTVTPRRPVRLEGLILDVRMPRREAPFYVTTAGGWTSSFGETPERWDCRESSLGSRRNAFVPYLFFTDSDRGFTVFADNDAGWILDPERASQEFRHEGDDLVVRFHFVNRPSVVERPFTVRYGWMTTPQKPQPSGWRAVEIDFRNSRPEVRTLFFADPYNSSWWFVYPYYASPFPMGRKSGKIGDYGEFAGELAKSLENPNFLLAAGNIMHSIARYVDDKGRWFNELAAEWGLEPGKIDMGNVALGKGPNDFRLWHIDKAVQLSGLRSLYFDETYLGEDWNPLSGGAVVRPDGAVEPGYHFLGMRDFSKRLRYVFHNRGKPYPNLWYHTTAQHPVHAWLNDVSWEGENVMPGGRELDYLEVHPASRLRSIGMGRNLGVVPMIFCQANQGFAGSREDRDFLTHQFVGWVLAHDCLPTRDRGIYSLGLLPQLEFWDDAWRFRPYWKSGQGILSKTAGVSVSAHTRPEDAVLWIVNTNRADTVASLELDLAELGLAGEGNLRFDDLETGTTVTFKSEGSRAVLEVPVPARLWRGVRIRPAGRLTGGRTLAATFDGPAEALGCRPPEPAAADRAPGKTGQGVRLDRPLTAPARLHVSARGGEVGYRLQRDWADGRSGCLFRCGGLELIQSAGQAMWVRDGVNQPVAKLAGAPGLAWHEVAVRWDDKRTVLWLDGVEAASIEAVPRLPDFGRGVALDAADQYTLQPATITIGPVAGSVLDDLVLAQCPD